MKLKELIKKLQSFHPELEVIIRDDSNCEIHSLDDSGFSLGSFEGSYALEIVIGEDDSE